MKHIYFFKNHKYKLKIIKLFSKHKSFVIISLLYPCLNLSSFLFIPIAVKSQQWVNVTPGAYETLTGDFINENKGWICKNGNLLHTDDGTQTFDLIYSFLPEFDAIIKLDMIDDSTGFGTALYENDYYLLCTKDGGYSWQNITDTSLMLNGALKSSTGYFFMDEYIGFFGGQNCIYKTEDSGNNWTEMITPQPGIDPLLLGESYQINQISFYDNNFGWAICSWLVDAGLAMKTTNGGFTWGICETTIGYPDMWDIHFIDSLKCGISSYGMGKAVLLTEDNFLSLAYIHYNWPQENYTICYQNNSTIWVSGIPPILSRSINSGESFDIFQEVELPGISTPGINDIQFFGNTGFAIGNKFLLKFQDTTTVFNSPNLNFYAEFDLWPIPVNDNLNISFNSKFNDDIEILIYSTVNNEFEIIKRKQIYIEGKIIQVNLEMLQTGLYLFIFKSKEKNIVRKIIKI